MSLIKKVAVAAAGTIAVATLAACGGSETKAVPDVTGKRLDVALADFEDAGFGTSDSDIEVLGGGMFGVLDESNWYVCEQDPAPGKAADGNNKPRVMVERECEGSESPESANEAGVETEPSGEPEPEAAEPAVDEEMTPAPEKKPKEKFVMPALVGQNLQDAQDVLQARGSWVLTQTDATGLERFQVLDANWKVCWQKPAPGKRIPNDTLVDLGAVKLDEACP